MEIDPFLRGVWKIIAAPYKLIDYDKDLPYYRLQHCLMVRAVTLAVAEVLSREEAWEPN